MEPFWILPFALNDKLNFVPDASANAFPFRLEFPPELPISARAEEITQAIQSNQVVILAGETGSGKTTQIPKMCLAAGGGQRGRIACTQPRRVAALSVSRRVAEEMGVRWGREVGCKIRFNDETTRDTVVKFLTDGMLLAEVQGDPLLRDYDTIIIDEAHERSLNIDFLLGHLRTLRYKRPELKIVITSATIDTAAFSKAFDDAPIIQVEGRTFPVEVVYAPLDELGSDYSESADLLPSEDSASKPSAPDEDEDPARPPVPPRAAEKAEALHYIDGTVEAVERVVRESSAGDILVFLPSERDIREVRDLLEGRLSSGRRAAAPELVPLFGRLSNAEQQRVFAATPHRKIILATNIAETSLTIPGIRFVVDTGLARISRYSPQARTRRLPIEPVSQSSADQRKGRSGRVADGVCIRLYSEKDYLERPRFTQPEIQRANLADVILRMKAFGLGDIERFPFINMPSAKSIRAGYGLLEELGALAAEGSNGSPSRPLPAAGTGAPSSPPSALNSPLSTSPSLTSQLSTLNSAAPFSRALTPLGRELARLPVDPTAGRMILQARTEKALREVLVIAAGLSVQDPRERPLDKQQQADAAHRRFRHPDSDFLTLLNIWDTYHDEFERLTQAKLRRFCHEHFLSYTRMREWRDIHAQLLDVLEERRDFRMTSVFDARPASGTGAAPATPQKTSKPPATPRHESIARGAQPPPSAHKSRAAEPQDPLAVGTPAYRAIHRSILAGLLGNIAVLDEENGNYKATHDRRVNLFPGSVLFRREEPRKRSADASQRDAQKKGAKPPRWIMAAEIMETSRLYARTCAKLDPAWALDLGTHLVRVSHSEPFWNVDAGRVMVKQRTRLYGLELDARSVGYGRIDPVHATEIFIREGLVNDTITFPLDFIAHNRSVRDNIEAILTRTRDTGYLNLDEAAYRFYAAHLVGAPIAGAQPSSTAQTAPVSSVAELVDLVRERRATEPRFLMMEPDNLRDLSTLEHDTEAFPEALPLDNRALPLNYAYKPGEADDGVTLELNVREAEALTPAALDWAVPGHLEAKVEHYLRALPKELRRGFVPLAETAKTLAAQLAERDRLTGRRETITEALTFQIAERFRVAVDPSLWADKPLPDYLRVRVRVADDRGRELCASRELAEIHAALHDQKREASVAVAHAEPVAWQRARARWEKPPQASWTFGELRDRVLVTEQAGVPVYAFPALQPEKTGVALRLFKTPEEADTAMREGVSALLELQLGRDIGWLERDLRALRHLGPLISTLTPLESLQSDALESLRRWLTDFRRVESAVTGGLKPTPDHRIQPTPATFAAALEKSKTDLQGLVPRLGDLLREVLTLRQTLLVHPTPYPKLDKDLGTLMPANFVRVTPYPQLAHFPRYLKAMTLRADRWRKNPAKDAERAVQLAPYVAANAKLAARAPSATGVQPPASAIESFRWLVEEFRVSLFAQELGTAEPVSAVKLDRALAELTGKPTAATTSETPNRSAEPPAIRPMTVIAAKKLPPIKNLGALDRLFAKKS
jgi:ATP-dependent helicase HrpA